MAGYVASCEQLLSNNHWVFTSTLHQNVIKYIVSYNWLDAWCMYWVPWSMDPGSMLQMEVLSFHSLLLHLCQQVILT